MDPETLRYYSKHALEAFNRYETSSGGLIQTRHLGRRRRDSIIHYWDELREHFLRRFEFEAKASPSQYRSPGDFIREKENKHEQ